MKKTKTPNKRRTAGSQQRVVSHAELEKKLKDSKRSLKERIAYANEAGVCLIPEIKAYQEGAIWALEWALGLHG